MTSTSAPPGVKGPYEVGRRHGYWVAEPDRPSARWLMPIVNSGESWSPDGTRIVYRSSWTAISIIDVRSGDKRVLVEDPGRHLSDPLWSPDGRHIAVHETQLDRPPVLLILDVSGREVARYPDWVDGQQGYSWSPDGARIAFASHRPETKSAWLSIAKVGEAATRIATGDDTQRFLGLQWSPRGTHLGWTYDEDLHLLDLSTSQQRTFALDGSPIYGHAWAPAEDRLVVWSNRLFLMRPDGSSVRTLDPAGHNASIDPVTGRIGWISGYGAGRERGIVSSPNGDEQEVVLTTAPDAAIDGLTWSPASGQFLFIQYG